MEEKCFEQDIDQMDQFARFMEEDIENVRRVIRFCKENRLNVEFKVHAKSETAEESAKNNGVKLDQVVKTLVFKAGDEFIAVLCPGDRRVDEEKLEETTGEEVRMARPGEVKEATGYVVGGVSPFDLEIPVYMEEKLLERDIVKPAAGSRVVGVEISPEKLKEVTGSGKAELTS